LAHYKGRVNPFKHAPWLANSGLLQAIFYVVAGLGWVLPAMTIVSWMSRPDRAA